MKIVFLLSYPIYHDFWTKEQWLKLINQNRWIPGILSSMGFEVEYWAVDHSPSVHTSKLDGFGDYTIRIFHAAKKGHQTKYDFSNTMAEYAEKNPPDIFLIKGVDGGIGTRLIKKVLIPESIPYVMVTGGEYYHPLNKQAELIIHESDYQKRRLIKPGVFFWRHTEPEEKLIKMQKSIDTEVFKPMDGIKKEFDTISVGRIVKRNKRFNEIGELSKHFKVAILGDGPYKKTLQQKYPLIHWLDRVPNADVPKVLNRAKLYIHPSAKDWIITRDFYPRAIAEAFACGLPCVGFDDAIQKDIIPNDCGIIVSRKNVAQKVNSLLSDTSLIDKMSLAARERAVTLIDKYSAKPALETVFNKLELAISE
ncbi:MAG: glycosyltransferase family 4 protein [Balneolaceae bacterium]